MKPYWISHTTVHQPQPPTVFKAGYDDEAMIGRDVPPIVLALTFKDFLESYTSWRFRMRWLADHQLSKDYEFEFPDDEEASEP